MRFIPIDKSFKETCVMHTWGSHIQTDGFGKGGTVKNHAVMAGATQDVWSSCAEKMMVYSILSPQVSTSEI